MTTVQALLAFIAAASILTLTPGADTAMVLRAAASEGPRPAAFAAIGIGLGCLIWGAAVSLGLGALLAASETAFLMIKWAGAIYLLYLGTRLILKPRNTIGSADGVPSASAPHKLLQQGLVTNLLNPKIGVFYITFLPQFIPAGVTVATFSLLLAAIHVVLGLLWFGVLIVATVPMARFLRRAETVRVMDRITGGLFIAFGVRLALSR